MTDLLFDAPWWLPTILAGLGLYVFWSGNRRQEPKIRNAGLALLAGAVGVLLLSYFVDTPKEKAVKRSKQLVHAVEARDWATLKTTLDPTVSLSVLGFNVLYENRDDLIKAAQRGVDQYGIKNVHVLGTDAEQTESLITVNMSIVSEQEATMGRPVPTSWKLEWQRSGNDWTLTRVTCIKIGNLTGETAARQFPVPR
jgi:hypothetical protein